MGAKVIDLGDRRMGAKIIDGKKIAAEIRAEIKVEVDRYIDEGRRPPALAVILVGRDHASQIYVKNKRKDCAKAGIKSVEHLLNDSVKEIELLHVIDKLNRDSEIDGILVQLPLPGKRRRWIPPGQHRQDGYQNARPAPVYARRNNRDAKTHRH